MDITELIDAAAQAAVEHEPLARIQEVLPDMRQRTDGLYNLPAQAWQTYSHGRPDATRAGAFRWFNNVIADLVRGSTTETGAALIARREKINAAIERGDI